MPANGEVSRAVYRGICRWVKAAADVPFTLRSRDIQAVLPTLDVSRLGDDSGAVLRLMRSAFTCHRDLQDEQEASEALEAGLRGLRLLNSHYASQIAVMREERARHQDRTGVDFAIGQVVRHRRFDYRGVIYGWDAACAREPGWAESLRLDPDQPFYRVLPDELDCQRAFGSVRITKYVAQENVVLLEVPRRVTNRALEHYFRGYSPSRVRYVPNKQLAFQYPDPDDYEANDVASCRADTNILGLGDEAMLPVQKSAW